MRILSYAIIPIILASLLVVFPHGSVASSGVLGVPNPNFGNATTGTSSVWWVGAKSADSSALPNTGVRATIQVVSVSASVLDLWVADDLSNNMWGQVGYVIQSSSGTTPWAFWQVWNLNTNTEVATGSVAVSTGSHMFSMFLSSGTTWDFAIDGSVFGTYNMGASISSSTYPVYALSEEQGTSVFSIPEITFSSAIQVQKSGAWSSVTTGQSYGNAWGVQGINQNPLLGNDEIIVGGSLPALSIGSTLWPSSGGTTTTSATTSTSTLPPPTTTVTSIVTSTVTTTFTSPTTTTISTTVTSPTTVTSTRTVTTTVTSLLSTTQTDTTTSTVTTTATSPTTITSTQTGTTTLTSAVTTTTTKTTTTTVTSTSPSTTTVTTTLSTGGTDTTTVTSTITSTPSTTITLSTSVTSTVIYTTTETATTTPSATSTVTEYSTLTTSVPITTTVTAYSTVSAPTQGASNRGSTSTQSQSNLQSNPGSQDTIVMGTGPGSPASGPGSEAPQYGLFYLPTTSLETLLALFGLGTGAILIIRKVSS